MATATPAPEPILASWRISDVLRRYPALLDVLVGLGPAFSHLRNPILRKVQTRLVTVAQAAQIAGLEPAALVRQLNVAAGLAPAADEEVQDDDPSPTLASARFEQATIAADLDARPLLTRGEEPFRAIMAAAATVPAGQVLRLRAPFEPVPLYDVLQRRGFAHLACQHGPEDWEVLFLHTAAPSSGKQSRSRAAEADVRPVPNSGEGDAFLRIDVSDLVPPEPMVRILEALEALAPGQTLLVEHVRRPVFLYPRLDELGYQHETRELAAGRVELRIHKPLVGADAS